MEGLVARGGRTREPARGSARDRIQGGLVCGERAVVDRTGQRGRGTEKGEKINEREREKERERENERTRERENERD